MKRFMSISATACLILLPSLSNAKTIDWTPYLKTMTANCELPDLDKPIPNAYKSSISKVTGKRVMDQTGTAIDGTKTYHLKNASLFGYPLTKIQVSSEAYSHGDTTFYFANSNFMQLRNKFYTDTQKGKLYASEKRKVTDDESYDGYITADGKGYSDGLNSVIFDSKKNTLTCYWSTP